VSLEGKKKSAFWKNKNGTAESGPERKSTNERRKEEPKREVSEEKGSRGREEDFLSISFSLPPCSSCSPFPLARAAAKLEREGERKNRF